MFQEVYKSFSIKKKYDIIQYINKHENILYYKNDPMFELTKYNTFLFKTKHIKELTNNDNLYTLSFSNKFPSTTLEISTNKNGKLIFYFDDNIETIDVYANQNNIFNLRNTKLEKIPKHSFYDITNIPDLGIYDDVSIISKNCKIIKFEENHEVLYRKQAYYDNDRYLLLDTNSYGDINKNTKIMMNKDGNPIVFTNENVFKYGKGPKSLVFGELKSYYWYYDYYYKLW